MSENFIHETAIVSPEAKIGEGVKIGPYSIIESDVEIGSGTEIRSHVVLADGARIGENCRIHTGCVISTEPQDLKYDGEKTYAFIGDNTVLREFVTVNRGTTETGSAKVGSECLIMTYSHIAHDCRVGDKVVMSNSVQLAGHVHIDEQVWLGGVVKIHQFCKIGAHAYVGADLKVVKDIPPYTLVARDPGKIEGVNIIGLHRRGFSSETIKEIQNFYKHILHSGMNVSAGIKSYREHYDISPEIKLCIDFIESSERGIYT